MTHDVAIIGAGVIGSAIAARLSRCRLRVLWLEAAHDVAEGASKANSGIAGTGYDMPTGTLESDLVLASRDTWESTCEALDVPFERVGSLSFAFDEDDLAKVEKLAEQAANAGARFEVLDGARLRETAAGMAPDALAALHVPGEAVVDPIRLTIGRARLAVTNGVDLRCSTPATGFLHDRDGRVTHVVTPKETFAVGAVVNAAGVNGDVIARAAKAESFEMWPRKGMFLLLDRAVGERVTKILTTIPTEHTRGVLAVPTTNRTVLVGPTATDETDKTDKTTDEETLDWIWRRAGNLIPALSRDHVIKVFAGLRPAADRTYRIEVSAQVPNLVHATGIRSTGVQSSPAVADLVCSLLESIGVPLTPRLDSRVRLPRVPRLAELSSADAASLANSTVVCACEHVTAAEIQAACTGVVPARSLDGVRKRTRAMAGRCQGAYCSVGVGFILSVQHGYEPWNVPQGEPGSEWGVGGA
ncbi:NAD(P)/FAD-dependent oxidoreductase [Acrocarpospora macrocephala]|uniref:FAD/NAD(P)-binding oxidoreductase n=1 Tax=Acrocarpospora macrocephala TaxID=150177 RepID=A0A5M3WSZ9_9ACTN|nr:NAD(P)/FAD-dependent oxidoreductase [Acrocarpospora macrocephala]GES11332.1 FAD/NAD(P)-binding oxidoreductase [Acrocarpospora macrocephala]